MKKPGRILPYLTEGFFVRIIATTDVCQEVSVSKAGNMAFSFCTKAGTKGLQSDRYHIAGQGFTFLTGTSASLLGGSLLI